MPDHPCHSPLRPGRRFQESTGWSCRTSCRWTRLPAGRQTSRLPARSSTEDALRDCRNAAMVCGTVGNPVTIQDDGPKGGQTCAVHKTRLLPFHTISLGASSTAQRSLPRPTWCPPAQTCWESPTAPSASWRSLPTVLRAGQAIGRTHKTRRRPLDAAAKSSSGPAPRPPTSSSRCWSQHRPRSANASRTSRPPSWCKRARGCAAAARCRTQPRR